MKGYIGFSHYKIDCIIGVYPAERQKLQTVFVDLKVKADFSKCSQSDNVTDTVNYVLLADLCNELAFSKRYRLLETFAADALHEIFIRFDVLNAWIRIKKPAGLPTAEYTVVELELDNNAK